jgi:hypothetical protein
MMSHEALCVLKIAAGSGVAVGLVLIVVGYFATYIVLYRDITKELDSKGLREPHLVKVIIHTAYIVIITGCFITLLSIATGLSGVLIMIRNVKF